MEERFRSDGFEATFVVSTPRAKAWELLCAAEPVSDVLPPPRAGQAWIPAVEAPIDEVERVPEERLRGIKATEPCRGTEIVITMEDDASGTRITIVQTGFGAGFDERRPWLAAGWYAILADYVTFFERGIPLGRHLTMWWSIGCNVEETPEGLVVAEVFPDGFAARAGMQPGDLIVRLAGAPVITIRDLSVLTRGPLRTGVDTTAHYLRGEQLLKGEAAI